MSRPGVRTPGAWPLHQDNLTTPPMVTNVRYVMSFTVMLDRHYPHGARSFGEVFAGERGDLFLRLFQTYLQLGWTLYDQYRDAMLHGAMLQDQPLVSFFIEALLEDPRASRDVGRQQQYNGRVDDVVVGYRFWTVVHPLDLNAACGFDMDGGRGGGGGGRREGAARRRGAAADAMDTEARSDEDEDVESSVSGGGGGGGNRPDKKGRYPRGYHTDPNTLLMHLIEENRRRMAARSSRRPSAPRPGVVAAPERVLPHEDVVNVHQWVTLVNWFTRGEARAQMDGQALAVRAGGAQLGEWRLDDAQHPYSARAVFGQYMSFLPAVCMQHGDGTAEPRMTMMPEQTHVNWFAYHGAPSGEAASSGGASAPWGHGGLYGPTLHFPLRAYVYRVSAFDWAPATVCQRLFLHEHRSRGNELLGALQCMQLDLKRRSSMLAQTDDTTGALQDLGGGGGGTTTADAPSRRRDVLRAYVAEYFGLDELDSAEEVRRKREALYTMGRAHGYTLEDEEARIRSRMAHDNAAAAAHTDGGTGADTAAHAQQQMNEAAEAGLDMAMQNYTSALGPLAALSRRMMQVIQEMAALYYAKREEERQLRKRATLSVAQRRAFNFSDEYCAARQRELDALRARYDYLLRSRNFTVVLRKLYLRHQDMLFELYAARCNTSRSDVGKLAAGMLWQRDHKELFALDRRPVQLRVLDPTLPLYANWEASFYLEAGALFFLTEKHRILSLMFKAQKDAYRVDFGLHYNILLLSEQGGTGKSMVLEIVRQLCVQGSAEFVSSQSTLAEASDDVNRSNQTVLLDEISMSAFGTNTRNADMEQERNWKERMTSNVTRRRRLRQDDQGLWRTHVSYSECIAVHFSTSNANVFELWSSAMRSRMHIITVQSASASVHSHTVAAMTLVQAYLNDHPAEARRMEDFVRRCHVQQLMVYDVEKLIHVGAVRQVSMEAANVFLLYMERQLLAASALTFAGEGRNFQRTMILARVNCILDALTQVFFVPSGEHYGRAVEVHMYRQVEPLLYAQLHHVVSAVGETIDLYVDGNETRVREALCYLVRGEADLQPSAGADSRPGLGFAAAAARYGPGGGGGGGGAAETVERNYLAVPLARASSETRSSLDAAAQRLARASRELHAGDMRRSVTVYEAKRVLQKWLDRARVDALPMQQRESREERPRLTLEQPIVEQLARVFCLRQTSDSQRPRRMDAVRVGQLELFVHPCFLYPSLKQVLARGLATHARRVAPDEFHTPAAAADDGVAAPLTDEEERMLVEAEAQAATAAAAAHLGEDAEARERREKAEEFRRVKDAEQRAADEARARRHRDTRTARRTPRKNADADRDALDALMRRVVREEMEDWASGERAVERIVRDFCRRRHQRARRLLFTVDPEFSALRRVLDVGPSDEELAHPERLRPLRVLNVAYRTQAVRAVLDDDERRDAVSAARTEHDVESEAFRAFVEHDRDRHTDYDRTMTTDIEVDIDQWALEKRMRALFITGDAPVSPTYRDVPLEAFRDATATLQDSGYAQERELRARAHRLAERVVTGRAPLHTLAVRVDPRHQLTHAPPTAARFFPTAPGAHRRRHGHGGGGGGGTTLSTVDVGAQQQASSLSDLGVLTDSTARTAHGLSDDDTVDDDDDDGAETSEPAVRGRSVLTGSGSQGYTQWMLRLETDAEARAQAQAQRHCVARLVFLYMNQDTMLDRRGQANGAFFLGEPYVLFQDRVAHERHNTHSMSDEQRRQLVEAFDVSEHEHTRYSALRRCAAHAIAPEDDLLPDVDFDARRYLVSEQVVRGERHALYAWQYSDDVEEWLSPLAYKTQCHHPLERDTLYYLRVPCDAVARSYPEGIRTQEESYATQRAKLLAQLTATDLDVGEHEPATTAAAVPGGSEAARAVRARQRSSDARRRRARAATQHNAHGLVERHRRMAALATQQVRAGKRERERQEQHELDDLFRDDDDDDVVVAAVATTPTGAPAKRACTPTPPTAPSKSVVPASPRTMHDGLAQHGFVKAVGGVDE